MMYSMYRNSDPPTRAALNKEVRDGYGDRMIRRIIKKAREEAGEETEEEKEKEELDDEQLAAIRDAPATFRTPAGMRPLEEGEEEPETEEEEEEVEVEVIKFTHEGKEYLRDIEGRVYDIVTQDEVGEWDDESKTLTLD
jgi:hypothetical protein